MDDNLDPDHPLKGSSDILIYDTFDIKPLVKENNPKFFQSLINKHKRIAKKTNNKNYDPKKLHLLKCLNSHLLILLLSLIFLMVIMAIFFNLV